MKTTPSPAHPSQVMYARFVSCALPPRLNAHTVPSTPPCPKRTKCPCGLKSSRNKIAMIANLIKRAVLTRVKMVL